jgi:fatty acid desaturase
MAKLPNPYRRLPGTGSGAFETVRLYQAADHLLQVSASGYTETYRRFYFRDIQGFAVNESVKGRNWNGVWGILGALCAVAAIQVGGPAAIVWWGIAGTFLLLLIINVAGGPTCVCQIRTAVQTRPLPSLGRLRRAVKTIAQLRPHIEAAQGALPAEEIVRRIDDARRGPSSMFTNPVSVSANPPVA